MCGITGFIDFNFSLKEEHLGRMLSPLHHRGPDDAGHQLFTTPHALVGLAMRRLSILELSTLGHQPMSFEDITLVFNGEIYNFREIRKELQAIGYSFVSDSDTEVILKAYHAWGAKCTEKFIGMFAITLYDKRRQEVIMIRDRAGVKPLYIYNQNGIILFASELKSFHSCPKFQASIDLNSAAQFFKYGYIPAPYCIYKYTAKLKPGHILKIDLKNQETTLECYWDVLEYYNKPKLGDSFSEALLRTEEILISACKYRMVSDVPVGVFLSGGYDSSVVTAILQKHSGEKIKTFSIGFHEDSFNEAVHAKRIAQHLGTDHHEYYCSVNDAKGIVPDLPEIYDEPFGDSSAVPTTLVSKVAAREVKVALSADAGDEIFAGYGNYSYFLRQHDRIKRLPGFIRHGAASAIDCFHPVLSKASGLFYNFDTRLGKLPNLLRTKSAVEFNATINQYFTDFEIRGLLNGKIADPLQTGFKDHVNPDTNDFINLQLAIGYKTFLVDDILTKVDRATMSVSLEGREPLLDHRIVEYVAQLPSEYKYHNGVPKFLLKEIAHKYIPKVLIDRPKMGFSIPVEQWLKGDLNFLLDTHLSRHSVDKIGVLDFKTVDKIRREFLKGHRFNFSKIWFILMFQMWAERWMHRR